MNAFDFFRETINKVKDGAFHLAEADYPNSIELDEFDEMLWNLEQNLPNQSDFNVELIVIPLNEILSIARRESRIRFEWPGGDPVKPLHFAFYSSLAARAMIQYGIFTNTLEKDHRGKDIFELATEYLKRNQKKARKLIEHSVLELRNLTALANSSNGV